MLKFCHRCQTDKPLTEYNKHSKRADGVQTYCRLCQRSVDRAHWQASPKRQAHVKASRKAATMAAQQYVKTYLQEHPCVDCGEPDSPKIR